MLELTSQKSNSQKTPAHTGGETYHDIVFPVLSEMEAEGTELSDSKVAPRLRISKKRARILLEAYRARNREPALIAVESGVISKSTEECDLKATPMNLEDYEQIIREGVTAAFKAGEALIQIRDKGLYRSTHGTFEEYYRQRFSIERSQAHRLMDAARVLTNLSPIGDIQIPKCEAQVRPLASLKPEDQVLAWKNACRLAKGLYVTAKEVRQAVELVSPRAKPARNADAKTEPTSRSMPGQTKENPAAKTSIEVAALAEHQGTSLSNDWGSTDSNGQTGSKDRWDSAVAALKKQLHNCMPWAKAVSKDPARFGLLAESLLGCVTEAVCFDRAINMGETDTTVLRQVLELLGSFFKTED